MSKQRFAKKIRRISRFIYALYFQARLEGAYNEILRLHSKLKQAQAYAWASWLITAVLLCFLFWVLLKK